MPIQDALRAYPRLASAAQRRNAGSEHARAQRCLPLCLYRGHYEADSTSKDHDSRPVGA